MKELLTDVTKAAHKAFVSLTKNSKLQAALNDPQSPVLVLYIAAKRLLGEDFARWEPETIWKSLEICDANRDKLLVGAMVATYPAFYLNYRVFGNAILAMGNLALKVEEVPVVDPELLAGGVIEGTLLHLLTEPPGAESPEFDEEVEAYVAAALHASGLVLAPSILSFAQPYLDKLLNAEAKELKEKVQQAWRAHPTSNFSDSPLGVQLARQAEIEDVYLVNRLKDLQLRLSALS